jgi:hypothetical protein
MSKNVELSGILRNIAKALRDASAALEAVQRILGALFPPQDALEARLSALKQRINSFEEPLHRLIDRISVLETGMAQALLLMRRLAVRS